MTQPTILTQIINDKKQWLIQRQAQQPLEGFIGHITPSQRRFYQALQSEQAVFILECKKASPSKGLIRADFDPIAIAKLYQPYATAISVLTDEKYFQGSFDYLTLVSQTVNQPVLCKDFIIDPYQVYLARFYQADAILLMLSVLDDQQYCQLAKLAHQLKMGVLTEVSTPEEVTRAIALQAKVIGINNRNLRDLTVDLNRTQQLASAIPAGTIIISESGIHTHQQVRTLRQYANGFLIGSALMAQTDPQIALKQILFGDNKVCGLTRPSDAAMVAQAGAVYGGLIFADRSPRCVTLQQAQMITQTAPLRWIAVFADQPLQQLVDTCTQLPIFAVQLHGNEDNLYIAVLRQRLPANCQIWKACSITDSVPELKQPHIDRYLFDHGKGGTGHSFDWSLLQGIDLHRVILAGGLNIKNITQAAQLPVAGLDINSGVEEAPGIKNRALVTELFTQLRNY